MPSNRTAERIGADGPLEHAGAEIIAGESAAIFEQQDHAERHRGNGDNLDEQPDPLFLRRATPCGDEGETGGAQAGHEQNDEQRPGLIARLGFRGGDGEPVDAERRRKHLHPGKAQGALHGEADGQRHQWQDHRQVIRPLLHRRHIG